MLYALILCLRLLVYVYVYMYMCVCVGLYGSFKQCHAESECLGELGMGRHGAPCRAYPNLAVSFQLTL